MDDLVPLIDELQELRMKKAALDERIKELQARLVEALTASEAKTVCGTQVKVTLTTRRGWSMPKAGTAERAAFEDELRALGLYEQASAVSASAFGKLMKDEALAPEARERLEAFAEERESTSLRVSGG